MADSSYQKFSNNDTNQTPKNIKLIDNKDGTFSISTQSLETSIAKGDIVGASPFGAYGKIVTIGAVTDNVIWADGIWTAPPAVGARISVVSTSANDSSAGTGIRTIEIHYLDSNLDVRAESLTLNGLTPVLTVATDMRFIQCAHMTTYGTLKKAAGIISFKNSVTAATYNQIDTGANRCSSSARMVPNGKKAIVTGLVGSSVSGTATTSAIINIASTAFDGHNYTADSILIPFGSIGVQDSALAYTLPIPAVFNEGEVIAMTCTTDKAAIVTGDWFGYLENA